MPGSFPPAHLLPWVERHLAAGARVVGLHGCQGSGKTTTCTQLVESLAGAGVRAVTVSIDDFYLTRAERLRLSERVHPLLETRGVPGTHDVALARRTLAELRVATAGSQVAIPRFDKDTDDRGTEELQFGRMDLVLFEGWCVGLPPYPADRLAEPFNDLEREHDQQGTWRRFVAEQLCGPYAELWTDVDALAALIPPQLSTVVTWRAEAETKRLAARADGAIDNIEAFVAHYARWTAWGMEVMPQVADFTLRLDALRRVVDSTP